MSEKYNNIQEVIKHYFECSQNNDWKNFNFKNACKLLNDEIFHYLWEYGQIDEDGYVECSLDCYFPGWSEKDKEVNYPENKELQVIKDAYESGNPYCFFKNPISTCEEFETLIFRKLQEDYKDDPDIEYLKHIEYYLYDIAFEGDNVLTEKEMIEIIWNALNAKHPRGTIFNLKIE